MSSTKNAGRTIALATGTAVLVAGFLPLLASPAMARATSCQRGDVSYTVGDRHDAAKITHVKPVPLAPGSSYKHSTTVEKVLELSAGIDGSYSATVEANAIIGKASSTYGITVHAAGKHTNSSSVTDTWSMTNDTKKQRRYALYVGNTKYSGSYTRHTCNSDGRTVTNVSGTWTTFNNSEEGTALCGVDPGTALGREALRQINC